MNCLNVICFTIHLQLIRISEIAPEAVLEADGGTLTDVLGNHYQYGADVMHLNKSGVIATIKEIDHSRIINKIPDELKKKLSS